MAVFAPIPIARQRMAATVRALFFHSERRAYRKSSIRRAVRMRRDDVPEYRSLRLNYAFGCSRQIVTGGISVSEKRKSSVIGRWAVALLASAVIPIAAW